MSYLKDCGEDWAYSKRLTDPHCFPSFAVHKLGLGLPHVASRIRSQRLQLLQRAMTQSTADRPLWQPLVLRQFERSMGQLYRASNPYDFLLYHPHPSSKWLMLWEVHPLWIDVWSQWSATPINLRMQLPLTPATTMHLPVWLTTYEPTMANGMCAASTYDEGF
ncbi:hypothetical protein H257_03296 [Aphanomyces astaci]|uniref:Uncharacterized protein n=1 Tax=Aphanomyces astaci TaxID=112090 RepID=W4H374_APHAT|nr:hypothetical protein H257_03296 [Aphanomyces astaci]ETV85588.1 hypothetical protein H257_03296 [Aphanomyces astaci]|eukprot:XP_009825606.1 hypothetical protein H257_03296 [Aphanomyces astaci]